MIRFSLFEWTFRKPEVPPIIQNAVKVVGNKVDRNVSVIK